MYGAPETFSAYNHRGQTTIDSAYVSGVAVMYGSPRQHIWTFANGARENDSKHRVYNFPCDTNGVIPVPPFVEKITSVSLGTCGLGIKTSQIGPDSTPMIFSGMGETVILPVHVVLSTILHISPKPVLPVQIIVKKCIAKAMNLVFPETSSHYRNILSDSVSQSRRAYIVRKQFIL